MRFSSLLALAPVASLARVALVLAAALTCLACNEAPLIRAGDAGGVCQAPVLEFACHPQPAAAPGCAPDLDSGGALAREVILDGGSYPPGCTVIVYAATPDLDNQCSQLGTCNCMGDAAPFNWVCRQ